MIFQKILPESLDAVLYLDTDHVFLSNVSEIWEYFEENQRQNPNAVVSLANHVPQPNKYSYHFRDIPFAGNGGMQSSHPSFTNFHPYNLCIKCAGDSEGMERNFNLK